MASSFEAEPTPQLDRLLGPPERIRLRLFVAGATARSSRAIATIKELCERHFADRYDLEIIDVYQQPDLAQIDGVLATPTLIRLDIWPRRWLVGDLGRLADVYRALGLTR